MSYVSDSEMTPGFRLGHAQDDQALTGGSAVGLDAAGGVIFDLPGAVSFTANG